MRPSLFLRQVGSAMVVALAVIALQACTTRAVQAKPGATPQRVATLPAPGVAAAASTPPRVASGRLRPPPTIACDRNHLTSWSGRVTGYKPGKDATWFEIATDEDTVESATIPNGGAADSTAHYLLQGAAFSPGDMARIESAPGKLRPGMRATAWICEDGSAPPLLDWRPPPD